MPVERPRARLCPPYISSLSLLISFSFLSSLPTYFIFRAPSRGACGAPVALGCLRGHPYSHAMTGVQTPHRTNGPSKCPPCVRCAPQGARGRVRYAQTEAAKPRLYACRISGKPDMRCEASCVSSDWKRSPLRRSTWDFWPGPVLAVVPPSLKLRRASPPELKLGHRSHPSGTSCEGLSGQPRRSLRDRAPFTARVIVTRRSRSRGPPRHGR